MKRYCMAMVVPVIAASWIAAVEAEAQPAPAPPRHPAQRIPVEPEFPTGPAVGERLPDFSLPDQRGRIIDFHADRAGSRAAVLFQRSAVW